MKDVPLTEYMKQLLWEMETAGIEWAKTPSASGDPHEVVFDAVTASPEVWERNQNAQILLWAFECQLRFYEAGLVSKRSSSLIDHYRWLDGQSETDRRACIDHAIHRYAPEVLPNDWFAYWKGTFPLKS